MGSLYDTNVPLVVIFHLLYDSKSPTKQGHRPGTHNLFPILMARPVRVTTWVTMNFKLTTLRTARPSVMPSKDARLSTSTLSAIPAPTLIHFAAPILRVSRGSSVLSGEPMSLLQRPITKASTVINSRSSWLDQTVRLINSSLSSTKHAHIKPRLQ